MDMKTRAFIVVFGTALLLLGDCTTKALVSNCGNSQFQCGDSSYCLPASWKCDGANDCPDGSDEHGCVRNTCASPSLFRCSNDNCILMSWKCDGYDDCRDNSDESDEICSEKLSCEFKCGNGKCLDSFWVCDKHDDCGDNSDEENCGTAVTPSPTQTNHLATTTHCSSSEFQCHKDRKCVPKKWKCDGAVDCKDSSDERNCGHILTSTSSIPPQTTSLENERDLIHRTVPSTTLSPTRGAPSEYVRGLSDRGGCRQDQFLCSSGKCIFLAWVCDGDNDCDDNSDETNCESIDRTSLTTETQGQSSVSSSCDNEHFQCTASRNCIHNNWVCDHERDCTDGSDEVQCVTNPSIILAAGSSIKSISEDFDSVEDLYEKMSGVVALDVDIHTQFIYWSDLKRKQIRRGNLNSRHSHIVISSNLGLVEGIAVDWVGRKLYWTDSLLSSIEVSELLGENRKKLIGKNLDKPRAIAVHPLGYIFWTEWGTQPRLSRCSMDGKPETRQTLIDREIIWPNALTIDYSSNTLWWADAKLKKIEQCDLNGSNRKVVLREDTGHPFSLAVSSRYIYWTNWDDNTLDRINTNSAFQYTKNTYSIKTRPLGIALVDGKKHEAVFSDCSVNNGGCSHLCLLSSQQDRFSCQCPDDMELERNLKRCRQKSSLSCPRDDFNCDEDKCIDKSKKCDGKQDCEDGTDEHYCLTDKPRLIFGNRRSYVAMCDLTRKEGFKIIEKVESVTGIDVDVKNGYVFWADTTRNALMKSVLDHRGELLSTENITDKYVFTPEGLAFDWITNKLYWIDSQLRKIEVIDLAGKHRYLVVKTGLDKPRSLVLHPKTRYLFWTDWGRKPYLATISMDGNPDTRRLLVETGIVWPNAVTIDYTDDVLYWADAALHRIEKMDLGGATRTFFMTTVLSHPFSMTVFKQFVYWSEWHYQGIFRVNKYTGLQDSKVRKRIFRPTGLVFLDKYRQLPVIRNPCAIYNGGCSHICLLNPSPRKYACRCPSNMQMSKDGKTCQSLYYRDLRKTNSLLDISAF